MLGKARKEAAEATGTQLQELTDKVASFEAKLDEARKKKEKAIARAQLTKSGFVYIISNIGAFGEGVFKIGMTRRMEPMERIIELSGAAVPFPFDLHAMLYSDNAPENPTNVCGERAAWRERVQSFVVTRFIGSCQSRDRMNAVTTNTCRS